MGGGGISDIGIPNLYINTYHAYSVMQSDGNSLGGDVVLDSVHIGMKTVFKTNYIEANMIGILYKIQL